MRKEKIVYMCVERIAGPTFNLNGDRVPLEKVVKIVETSEEGLEWVREQLSKTTLIYSNISYYVIDMVIGEERNYSQF